MFIFLTFSRADLYTVTNTQNSGAGSLRQTINDANTHTGPDTIFFDISDTDPGYDASQGVWIIQPEEPLPIIQDDSTMIKAETQTKNQGDQNPDGPEIMLYGKLIDESVSAFTINSAYNIISGMVISGFSESGIFISGDNAHHNQITRNYIGTNVSGSDTLGNGCGIFVVVGSSHNIIGGEGENDFNIISGNHNSGIFISYSDSNLVIGNRIGTDVTGTFSLGNRKNGVYIASYCTGNIIGGSTAEKRNIISGNMQSGIYVYGRQIRNNYIQGNYIGVDINGTSKLGNNLGILLGWEVSKIIIGGLESGQGNVISGNQSLGIKIYREEADSNQVLGNFIGTGADGKSNLGNGGKGIELIDGTQKNKIGPSNVIRFNDGSGITVWGNTTLYNRITQNSISDNESNGILLIHGGNGELASPVITSLNSVSGTAPPNSTVEIFSDSLDQGMIYEATVTADGSGNFFWSGTPVGPNVTATATDEDGNTSEFSDAITVTAVKTADKHIPEQYFLAQNYPNPFNPETTIQFGVKKPCQVVLTVYNLLGKEVEKLVDEHYQPGQYEISFNVKEYTSGIYVYKIKMGSFQAMRKM
ncbi:MAG: T9SS type A sorting domain-containing protein, partial [bacterium]